MIAKTSPRKLDILMVLPNPGQNTSKQNNTAAKLMVVVVLRSPESRCEFHDELTRGQLLLPGWPLEPSLGSLAKHRIQSSSFLGNRAGNQIEFFLFPCLGSLYCCYTPLPLFVL